jgi:hypothetical protein
MKEMLVGAAGIGKTTILPKSHKIEALQPLLSRQALQILQRLLKRLGSRSSMLRQNRLRAGRDTLTTGAF